MLDITIRPACEDDVPAILDLIDASYSPHLAVLPSRPGALAETAQQWRQALLAGPVLVAEISGETAAVGRIQGTPPAGEVKRLGVHPAWQRCGLGQNLMLALEEAARDGGFNTLLAATRRRLSGNIRFYEALGYAVSRVEPYPDGIDDEVVTLSKPLNPDKQST
ncbi:GNAT family N-acetyltransferase [Chitinivorax sp. PXF-14]|uniref:GNAT family N-acetyltransferase n=1 Tax=Chitinivorax sp. PXF-14 TaxID=3230488 RepID=UPI0034670676